MAPTEQMQNAQQMSFQTEVQQLLRLMIHSLYTHKEVFIRELISNASDALDRLRFESISRPEVLGGGAELAIRITLDKKENTFTITDNGIGMTRQEVIDNIGTIARSGSKAFLERMTGDQKADSNMIGQFGVGFYSVFMAARKVRLVTKSALGDGTAVVWESDGESQYTLAETVRDIHGTEITLFLKDEEKNYSEEWEVRSLIKKYSDYIAFPIYLPDEKHQAQVINEIKPLWRRPPAEITAEQYAEFYKQKMAGFDEPLTVLHGRAEGAIEYTYLLFIPPKTPPDLFTQERKHGVKLFVKRVFIMDHCQELLPEYLRFMKGLVDSEDLPLNVSREMLQQKPALEKIRKALVAKILGKLKDMAEKEPLKYLVFWKSCGTIFKEGIHLNFENKDELLDLLRFQSSFGATADDIVSLRQYVDRMPKEQTHIYYLTGESREMVGKSPHLEIFKEKNIEVLYLVEPVDEWVVGDIMEYHKKKLQSAAKGNLDLGDLSQAENQEKKKAETGYKKLTEYMQDVLKDLVKEVRITGRLKDSPCCLVADEHEMSAQMEKLMQAMSQDFVPAKRSLEINSSHPIVASLNALYLGNSLDTRLADWVHLLYDQALIIEGQPVKDPKEYARRVNMLLASASADAVSRGKPE